MEEDRFEQQVLGHFGELQTRFGFWGLSSHPALDPASCTRLRMESDRFFIDFLLQRQGAELTLQLGRTSAVDLAVLFAYLTRGLPGSSLMPTLYAFPTYLLGMTGNAAVEWQLARLEEILQPLWPAVFIFLDRDGPHSAEFKAFQERIDHALAERREDGYRYPRESLDARAPLQFAYHVEQAFASLKAFGFRLANADPVFVRYEKTDGEQPVYLNVFHRSRSFQVGLHTGWAQAAPEYELDVDLEELAGWYNEPFQAPVARTASELQTALNRLTRLYRKYAAPVLGGDLRLFEALRTRRIDAPSRASRAWAARNRGDHGTQFN